MIRSSGLIRLILGIGLAGGVSPALAQTNLPSNKFCGQTYEQLIESFRTHEKLEDTPEAYGIRQFPKENAVTVVFIEKGGFVFAKLNKDNSKMGVAYWVSELGNVGFMDTTQFKAKTQEEVASLSENLELIMEENIQPIRRIASLGEFCYSYAKTKYEME